METTLQLNDHTLQLNGHMTISKSSKFSDAAKAKTLTSSRGTSKAIRTRLTDANGNEVVLEGVLRLSRRGSLTATFKAKCSSFEIFELADPNSSENEAEASEINDLEAKLLSSF